MLFCFAKKTAVLKILEIETGESDESRYEQQHPEYINEDQQSSIVDMINSLKDNEKFKGEDIQQNFLQLMKAESIEKIERRHFPKAMTALEKKANQK